MENNIKDIVINSVYFGVCLTLFTYAIGLFVHKKTKFFLFSPLIVSVTISILILVIFKIPYEKYTAGADMITFILTPATVCLAVPLYKQFEKLKQNYLAILGGIISGILTNLFLIFLMCIIFKIGHREYVSLLPKSITTAIGLSLSEELDGIMPITIMVIVITGNLGNLFAVQVCHLFRITEPVARGVAIGTASHAMGTSKAIEMGSIEGAMSGLSIAVTGLLTVVFAPFFAALI